MPQPLGIYVSIPFCRAKCTFCNFASEAFPPARIGSYVARLCREIPTVCQTAAALGGECAPVCDSIYLGGGTPSLLTAGQLLQVFGALREQFDVQAGAEITMEAAPGQIDQALLEAALQCGVNRISLGVQSFVDREAKAVGRLHTGEACLAEIWRLRDAGVPRLSIDLIAGLPYQTSESLAVSFEAAQQSGVEHVSVYMLETDGDSRLGTEVERLRATSQLTVLGQHARYHADAAANDELCAELYQQACASLAAGGFEQYEISNFSRAGGTSRHNQKYWDRAPYLGLGLDAHSMLPTHDGLAVRFQNTDELDRYVEEEGSAEVVHVDALAAFEETVFLGLRRSVGVHFDELERWNQPESLAKLVQGARSLQSAGLVEADETTLRLTAQGRVVSSAVFGELLA